MEKPLATLWRNYTHSSRPDVRMQLTVSGGGLKATTREHGLTEYWANRLTFCAAPPNFPRLFCWVYRHEGRKLRHELRCHAVLCNTTTIARLLEQQLKDSLALALLEFRRDKISRQNARLSLVNSIYENPTIPRRKILLSTGATNYRPPLERSKSAPKLTIIEENLEEDEEIFEGRPRRCSLFTRRDSFGEKRQELLEKLGRTYNNAKVPELIAEEHANNLDADSERVLDELAQRSVNMSMHMHMKMKNDLIESCKSPWLTTLGLGEAPDLIPDNDDGSLSSGCESAGSGSAITELESPFTNLVEPEEERAVSSKKTDFQVGGCVINRSLLDGDEVSLIPIGEQHADFSSLKVFKKRSVSESAAHVSSGSAMTALLCKLSLGDLEDDEENGSACSDESGYDEVIDCAVSSVGSVVLV